MATLTRKLGSLDLAEDAAQDAMVAALEHWPRTGVPDNPGAWLTTAARNAAYDRFRREAKRPAKEEVAMGRTISGLSDPDDDESVLEDDLLRMLFMCCHPALNPDAQVALSLRTVCGLTTTEIAKAFLVSEPTMGQRISRAKRKIATANVPFRIPPDHELPDRLDVVLATIYLLFTEAHHSSTSAAVVRVDLADEAVYLARTVHRLMPDEPEAAGLLALLLATHARSEARLDADGHQVLMAEQDRTRWDHAAIAEAHRLMTVDLRGRRTGPYQLQAAISCLHGLAPAFSETDWGEVAELYRQLEHLQPTAVVRVNRAVAVAEIEGPGAGLDLLDGLELDWHMFHAVRADLLRRLGRSEEATDAYRRALACEPGPEDRRFLEHRLAALDAVP